MGTINCDVILTNVISARHVAQFFAYDLLKIIATKVLQSLKSGLPDISYLHTFDINLRPSNCEHL